jgi:hypothetical protein
VGVPSGSSSRSAASRSLIVLAAGVAVVAVALAWGLAGAGDLGSGASSPRLLVTGSTVAAGPRLKSAAAATWCGTPSEVDATPNAVAGYPVHWIYAYPSDGEERFASVASAMQTDWEAIDAWWRGQDATRAPRSDLAPFSCGLQLDLSSVRLPLTGGELSSPQEPFELISDALRADGFDSPRSKYLVYYDGPVGDDNICGVAATVPDGFGMATTFIRSCPGVTAADVSAHELVHTLGAVPSGAPHECSPPDDGHTCDDARDLMYPYSDGTPLSGLVLDPGRDDYYGHAGAWPDVQDSPWLVQLDRQAPLNLAVSGPGRVVADVPGLDCGQTCTTAWNSGTRLVLTPTASRGAKVVRWSGPCTGASQCSLVTGQSPGASILFAPARYRISVRVAGRGRVRGPSLAIACPSRCSASVSSHSPYRLTASPAPGWRFRTWSGGCRGSRPSCVLPMTANTRARAVFVRG